MKNKKLQNMCLTGLLAALIFVITRFLPPIPLGNQGYVNLGDSVIYLSVLLLPTPLACAAAAIGAALSDLTYGYVLWVIPTFIIKPLIVLCAKALSKHFACKDLMITLSGTVGVVGYYLAEVILIRFFIEGGAPWDTALVGAAASIWGNVLQAFASGVIFYILAKVLRKIPYFKEKLLVK